jgi:tRNA-binding EMAP/Myf-like protein
MELIVAEIKSFKKHPDATKLNVCEVFDGKNTMQIVCGASNVRTGLRTILAPVGSTTPKGLQIKEAKLRGVDSHGMLCSARDIDVLPEDGIIDLPAHITLGTKLSEVPSEFLSSTPWYSYDLVDSIWENSKTLKCEVYRKNNSPKNDLKDFKLLSQTYFREGHYLYRHFKV